MGKHVAAVTVSPGSGTKVCGSLGMRMAEISDSGASFVGVQGQTHGIRFTDVDPTEVTWSWRWQMGVQMPQIPDLGRDGRTLSRPVLPRLGGMSRSPT